MERSDCLTWLTLCYDASSLRYEGSSLRYDESSLCYEYQLLQYHIVLLVLINTCHCNSGCYLIIGCISIDIHVHILLANATIVIERNQTRGTKNQSSGQINSIQHSTRGYHLNLLLIYQFLYICIKQERSKNFYRFRKMAHLFIMSNIHNDIDDILMNLLKKHEVPELICSTSGISTCMNL